MRKTMKDAAAEIKDVVKDTRQVIPGSDRWSSSDWVERLIEHPEYAESCPFETFDACNWGVLLRHRMEMAKFCKWETFTADMWMGFLIIQNKGGFEKHCDWSMFTGYSWVNLLVVRPEFGGYCDWNRLNGENWAYLLGIKPNFQDRCAWEKLTGRDWVYLLRRHPEFADKCDWGLLRGEDWESLLEKRPEFADHCKSRDRVSDPSGRVRVVELALKIGGGSCRSDSRIPCRSRRGSGSGDRPPIGRVCPQCAGGCPQSPNSAKARKTQEYPSNNPKARESGLRGPRIKLSYGEIIYICPLEISAWRMV